MNKLLIWLIALSIVSLYPHPTRAQPPSEQTNPEIKPVQTRLTELSRTRADEAATALRNVETWKRAGDARSLASALACLDDLPAPSAIPRPADDDLTDWKTDLTGVLERLKSHYAGIDESRTVAAFNREIDELVDQVSSLTPDRSLTTLDSMIKNVDRVVKSFPLDADQVKAELRDQRAWKPSREAEIAAERKVITSTNRLLKALWAYKIKTDAQDSYSQAMQHEQEIRHAYADALERLRESLVERHGCNQSNKLCLDAHGQRAGTALASPIAAGTAFDVIVFAEAGNYSKHTVVLELMEVARISVVVEPPDASEPPGQQGAKVACTDLQPEAAIGWEVLQTQAFTVPKSLGVTRGVVRFTRSLDHVNQAMASHSFEINHGFYYVDVGLFVAFVPGGKQNISARNLGDERYLATTRDLHVTAGLAINVFPGGRRRGELTAFSNLGCDESGQVDCKKYRRRRRAADLLGLQVGVDLDIRDPLDQFYLGLVFEPVTGVTFSVGAAVLKVDQLGVALSEGQLVASDADLKPRSVYEIRPCFSVGLSFDLFQAVRAARERASKREP